MTTRVIGYLINLLRETGQLKFARFVHCSTLFVLLMHFYGAFASLMKLLPDFSRGTIHNIQNSANDMFGINMVLAGCLPFVWLIWKFVNKPIKHPVTKTSDAISGWIICVLAYAVIITGGILANRDLDYFVFLCGDLLFVFGARKLLHFMDTFLPV